MCFINVDLLCLATVLKNTFKAAFNLTSDVLQNISNWHGAVRSLDKAIMERRGHHIEIWLKENMAAFLEDPEAVAIQVLES